MNRLARDDIEFTILRQLLVQLRLRYVLEGRVSRMCESVWHNRQRLSRAGSAGR
jgi:hypothetical protein